MAFFLRLFALIVICGVSVYAYLDRYNALVQLRIELPIFTKELVALDEENVRLQFEIEKLENPVHLMELAKKPEFSHLKYPYEKDIVFFDVEMGTIVDDK